MSNADASCRWALGVLIFEMVAGCPPFYHEDRVTMFKNICHVRYSMPAHFSRVSFSVKQAAVSEHACETENLAQRAEGLFD